MTTIYTVGYNVWNKPELRIAGLCQGLHDAAVTLLVDIRHSPCAADPTGKSHYGAKPWNLMVQGGIVGHLAAVGIRYQWLPELGNPQKKDPEMAALSYHLGDLSSPWPVHRGLALLGELINDNTCCLLSSCEKYEKCHRKLIVEAIGNRSRQNVSIVNLSRKGAETIR